MNKVSRKVVLNIEMYVSYNSDLGEDEVLNHVNEVVFDPSLQRDDVEVNFVSEDTQFTDERENNEF